MFLQDPSVVKNSPVIEQIKQTTSQIYKQLLLLSVELSTACHICGKKFLNEANMRKHLRFHSGRNFPCKYGCDVVYPNVAELVKHLRAFHPDLPKRSQLSSASGLEVPKKNLVRRPKSAGKQTVFLSSDAWCNC